MHMAGMKQNNFQSVTFNLVNTCQQKNNYALD